MIRILIPAVACYNGSTELLQEVAMSVHIRGMQVPEEATVDIRISMSAQANITAFVGRQKVTQFVMEEVSNQLRGDTPDLTVCDRLCWTVPVVLTSPAKGVR